jgi:hypothetical protein
MQGRISAFSRAGQRVQPRPPLPMQWMVIVDAMQRAQPLDTVDVRNTLRHQAIPLAMQPAGVLLGDARQT